MEEALNKIGDSENHSCRCNFRVRGIPESFTDSMAVSKELISHLLPDLSSHKLELDRAHRALTEPCTDGLPRDSILKPHYSVKEQVMSKAREMDLHLRVHSIQIFADISPTTVQKHRALKPLLQPLKNMASNTTGPFLSAWLSPTNAKSINFPRGRSGAEEVGPNFCGT